MATPSTTDLDLNKIGEARKSLVGVKLDQVQNHNCVALVDVLWVFTRLISQNINHNIYVAFFSDEK